VKTKTKVSTLIGLALIILCTAAFDDDCSDSKIKGNTTALDEQVQTENNQRSLFQKQPPPKLDWSLERDNLIKRFKLQNDRAVSFYMYVFVEGVAQPVGYYQINKVSSVDSQLTNTEQIVPTCPTCAGGGTKFVLPSPAEDGSYGTNGQGVFGFTPEDIYIEHNMHYIVSTIPLTFAQPVVRLAVVNTDEAKQMLEKSKQVMAK
jgi:hypothetical protein